MYSGLTFELPLPPVIAALAYGPMTAMFFSPLVGSGSWLPVFFNSTALCSAICRATAPSALAGIGFFFGGLSKKPHLNSWVKRWISSPSRTDILSVPFCTAVLVGVP